MNLLADCRFKVRFEEQDTTFRVGFDEMHVVEIAGDGMQIYGGEYTVTPSAHDAVVLETAEKIMREDVTVKKIPAFEVSNATGGNTFYIASEVQ